MVKQKGQEEAKVPVLHFVGIGISDESGISIEGLEALKGCSRIFAEQYTSLMPPGTLLRLEKLVGKKIEVLSRKQVEGEKEIIDALKESGEAALVSAGDPLIATTHISLAIAAKKAGAEVRVHHAASILSCAIGESGLQPYKFGKMATLAFWHENYKPMATYDVVAENLSRGLHTLLLLDIDEKAGPMKPSQAASLLLEMEKAGKKGIFSPSSKVVLLCGIGWEKACRKYATLGFLEKMSDEVNAPCAIIVPARLHFLEEEYLQTL